MKLWLGVSVLFLTILAARGSEATDRVEVPIVDGQWWQLTDDSPDVSPYTYQKDSKSKVCDFTIFKDTKHLFHLIACVRDTTAPGDRVFYHWTSESLDRKNWTPAGLFEAPRGLIQGAPTSQQAPHAFVYNGRYYFFYNSGGFARALASDDGATWKNKEGEWNIFTDTTGKAELFRMGRDVNLFRDNERKLWFAYYCGNFPGNKNGAMVARTAPELEGPWSKEEIPVRTEGNPESPFVLLHNGCYYLWQQMEVFLSNSPEHFEGQPINHLTGIWYDGKWAPEIIEDEGQLYLAAYAGGIWLAKLKWESRSWPEIEKWRTTTYAALQAERVLHQPKSDK